MGISQFQFRIVATVFLFLFAGSQGMSIGHVASGDSVRMDTILVRSHLSFRVSSSLPDMEFDGNARRISLFADTVSHILADSTTLISHLKISGMASPEGSDGLNARLSRQRMEAMASCLAEAVPIPDSILTFTDRGVPWEQLDSLVSVSDMAMGREVSDIIRHTPRYIYNKVGDIVDGRKKQLMELDRGRVWDELNRRFFPIMRRGEATLFAVRRTSLPSRPRLVCDTLPQPRVTELPPVADTVALAPACPKSSWSLTTNLLYWAALSWNGGVEYAWAERSALSLTAACAWWSKLSSERVYRWMDAELAYHYYVRPRECCHTGFFVGTYVQTGLFELMFGKKNRKGETIAAGLSAGYRWRLGDRLSLHTELGLGYAYTDYRYAVYMDNTLIRQGRNSHHYVGPTRASVSLVYKLNGRRAAP